MDLLLNVKSKIHHSMSYIITNSGRLGHDDMHTEIDGHHKGGFLCGPQLLNKNEKLKSDSFLFVLD